MRTLLAASSGIDVSRDSRSSSQGSPAVAANKRTVVITLPLTFSTANDTTSSVDSST